MLVVITSTASFSVFVLVGVFMTHQQYINFYYNYLISDYNKQILIQ